MRYNVTGNFTQISETSGTIQNISNIYTVEVSDRAETGSGILLYPLDKFSFNDTALFMRCLDVVGKAEIIVVPFDATEKGGGGGGNRPDFAVDQIGTDIVDNFVFSALAYPNATNPNLDGKTVLVLSVKDANGKSDVVKYIFVDLAKVIDVYSAGDSSILVTDGDISVQISKAQGNILSLADDGLFANLAVSGGVSGNFAVIGTSGLITDGGFSLADLGLPNKMVKVPTAIQNNVAIFGTSGAVADGGFSFADIADSIDAKIDKVTSPTQGDIVIFGLSGALADGGFSFADIADSIDTKIDKVATATSGHIAVFNSIGSVVDGDFSIAELQYELPVASTSVLGGFKVGSGLSMSGDSLNVTLEVPEEYTLPTASASVLGGVKVGDGLAMDGDTLNVTTTGGISYVDFTGATSIAGGLSGLVPAPMAGEEGYFLRGDGTWATPATSVAPGVILNSVTSGVEGGLWKSEINGSPVLKLRHGDYEYNFNYDSSTYLTSESSPPATVAPDTYILGTASVSSEGGLWYEIDDVAKLKYHSGNFIYGLNPNSMTYKGGNAELVAYLPLDSSPTADALGNTWTAYGNPTVTSGGTSFDGSSCLANSTISAAIGSSPWTVDFWANSRGTNVLTFFGTFNALYATSGSVTNSWVVLAWIDGNVCLDRCANDVNISAGLQPNTRHHFALTYDGTSLRVFIDGVLKSTTEWAVTLGGDFVIGARGVRSHYYDGILDHFRIWNKALWTYDFTPPTAEDYL